MYLPEPPEGFHCVVIGTPTTPWTWVHDFIGHTARRKVVLAYRVLVATAGDAWAYLDENHE